MEMKTTIVFIWVAMPCRLIGRYHHFEEIYLLSPSSRLKMKDAVSMFL
jgi:hypothetical protein